MSDADTLSVSLNVVFVDDSGQQKPTFSRIGPLVSLGAVVLPPESLDKFATLLERARSDLGVPSDVELKWSPERNTWLHDPANREKRVALYHSVLDAAHSCGVKTVVVVWDQGAVNWDEDRVKRTLLKWLYERISRCIEARDDDENGVVARGIVVADVPGGDRKEEKKWLADTLRLTNYGTEYVPQGRIDMPIVTSWSHHLPHLQLADLITSMTTQAVAGSEYARKFVPHLIRLAHISDRGDLSGVGVKLFPLDSLGNLYYHVFDQSTAWDDGVVHLPHRTWRYADAESLSTAD